MATGLFKQTSPAGASGWLLQCFRPCRPLPHVVPHCPHWQQIYHKFESEIKSRHTFRCAITACPQLWSVTCTRLWWVWITTQSWDAASITWLSLSWASTRHWKLHQVHIMLDRSHKIAKNNFFPKEPCSGFYSSLMRWDKLQLQCEKDPHVLMSTAN